MFLIALCLRGFHLSFMKAQNSSFSSVLRGLQTTNDRNLSGIRNLDMTINVKAFSGSM